MSFCFGVLEEKNRVQTKTFYLIWIWVQIAHSWSSAMLLKVNDIELSATKSEGFFYLLEIPRGAPEVPRLFMIDENVYGQCLGGERAW